MSIMTCDGCGDFVDTDFDPMYEHRLGYVCENCDEEEYKRELALIAARVKLSMEQQPFCYPGAPASMWVAVDDRTYDGPGSPIGTGQTQQQAANDLCADGVFAGTD